MPIDMILPVSITFSMVIWTLIIRWYIHPVIRGYRLDQILVPFLLLHGFRYIGLMFLIPGVTTEALDTRFSHPAAYGDLIAAVLALIAIGAALLIRRLPPLEGDAATALAVVVVGAGLGSVLSGAVRTAGRSRRLRTATHAQTWLRRRSRSPGRAPIGRCRAAAVAVGYHVPKTYQKAPTTANPAPRSGAA